MIARALVIAGYIIGSIIYGISLIRRYPDDFNVK